MIYFLQDPLTFEIKIGYTGEDTPEKRLKQLQAGNPRMLIVLGWIDGERPDEHQLHVRFKRDEVRREWFKPSPDVLRFILSCASRYPVHEVLSFMDKLNILAEVSQVAATSYRRGMAGECEVGLRDELLSRADRPLLRAFMELLLARGRETDEEMMDRLRIEQSQRGWCP